MAAGSWTAAHAHEIEPLIEALDGEAPGAGAVSLDMRGVRALDTFGAWLVERLLRHWRSRGREAQIVGLPAHYRGLLENVEGANLEGPRRSVGTDWVLAGLARLGRGVDDLRRELVPFLDLLGASCV